MTSSFLKTYELTLQTLAPVHVGSGVQLTKKEYIHLTRQGVVCMVHPEQLMRRIIKDDKLDEYEAYISDPSRDLYAFFQSCGWNRQDIDALTAYKIYEGDALNRSKMLSGVHTFCRDQAGHAYIPGSSLKGTLRTVLLADMLLERGRSEREPLQAKALEAQLLHTLNVYRAKPDDPLNSLLRCIRISDSEIIPDVNMTLCRKDDVLPHGDQKCVNLARECLKPDVRLRFALTLDTSIRNYVSIERLNAAIEHQSAFFKDEYMSYFARPVNAVPLPDDAFLFLGGGSGYFSKSLVYPSLPHERAVQNVAATMRSTFPRHYHEHDAEKYGISPHCMKYVRYCEKNYLYGLCRISFNEKI